MIPFPRNFTTQIPPSIVSRSLSLSLSLPITLIQSVQLRERTTSSTFAIVYLHKKANDNCCVQFPFSNAQLDKDIAHAIWLIWASAENSNSNMKTIHSLLCLWFTFKIVLRMQVPSTRSECYLNNSTVDNNQIRVDSVYTYKQIYCRRVYML